MQRALYDLEDRFAFLAHAAKSLRRKQRLWAFSLWFGLWGDRLGGGPGSARRAN